MPTQSGTGGARATKGGLDWQGGVPAIVLAAAVYEFVDSFHLAAQAALFPRIVSVGTAAGAAVVWWLAGRDVNRRVVTEAPGGFGPFVRMAGMAAAFYACCFVFGFYPSVFAVAFICPAWLGRRRWVANAVWACSLTVGCWLAFHELHLMLPSGLLWSGG